MVYGVPHPPVGTKTCNECTSSKIVSWKTAPCRLFVTAYSSYAYSQPLSIFRAHLLYSQIRDNKK